MRLNTVVSIATASIMILAACREPLTGPVARPAFDVSAAAAACPTPANFVVSDEAGLSAALAAASPGQVIALNGFIVVSTNVVISTPNITLTCATPGSGLTLQAGVIPAVDAVLNALDSGDVVENLVLVGTPTADAFFAGASKVRFANNFVTCGTDNVAVLYNAAPGGVITGNQVQEAGCFDGFHLQAGTDGSRVEGNTLVATSPNTSPQFGAIRVRDGTGVTIAKNIALGSWRNGIALADLSNSLVAQNLVRGALVYGIRARSGGSVRPGPVSIDGNLFRANVVSQAGVAGMFLTAACNNTFLGNNLQGNAGDVGAIFDTPTGGNVLVGNKNVVIDDGSFDCNGDGVLDPNIISGPGRVAHGQFTPAPEDVAGSGGKLR